MCRNISQTDIRGCAAENALKEEAKKPKYSLSLLKIVSDGGQPLNIRLAAALAFKNFIRHSYVVCPLEPCHDCCTEARYLTLV